MNIIDIENKRLSLVKVLNNSNSVRKKIISLQEFFTQLLTFTDQNIINSYLLEFAENFVTLLSKWEAFYLPPEESEKLIQLTDELKKYKEFNPFLDPLELNIARINNRITELNGILNGNESALQLWPDKIQFPLIEEGEAANENLYSYLESITVKISKGTNSNEFIVVPSQSVIEDRFQIQIENSWAKAIEIIKKYKQRLNPYHDVIINFDQKFGEYIGDSLGIALTLAFLRELFTFYNTPITFQINAAAAFTGGVNEKGEIIPIESEIYIRSKVKCTFFSPINRLVLHKNDEEIARNEKKNYGKSILNVN